MDAGRKTADVAREAGVSTFTITLGRPRLAAST